jgi:hypothetical protein
VLAMEDNVIEVNIFPDGNPSAEELQALHGLYTNFTDERSEGYLWHNECFALALIRPSGSAQAHLRSKTAVGALDGLMQLLA